MKLSKSLILGISLLGIIATNPLYAKDAKSSITPAETATLATIAVIDKNEILVSVVAMNKKVNSDVMDFAKMMVDQHGANLTQILQMANDLHAMPFTGGDAEKLSAEGKKDLMMLGGLDDTQFSVAYVNAMVKGHQAALDLIDHHLMQTTSKSEELKKFLTDTRAAVAMHLEHAKKLQASMKS